MSDLMNTGMHKLHLSNGKVITLLANREKTLIMSPPVSRESDEVLGDIVRSFLFAWSLIGVHVNKHVAGIFEKHSWGHTNLPDVVCELAMYRIRDVMYGPEEIDGEQQVQWYVRLNMPVTEIEGALDEEGRPTEEFQSVVCLKLWDLGLQYTTPLSDISPTGQMCTSFSFHVQGTRVVVSNRHYRDV